MTTVGFTGHRAFGTNLSLTLHRGYDADLGRWLSEDPIGLSDGPNLYAYVENRVTMWIDPLAEVLRSTPETEEAASRHSRSVRFWPRAAACAGSGEKPTFSHSLGDLSSADRLEVSVAGVTPVATITDPAKVEAIITFVERYRDGWTNVWSGAGSERIVTFYAGTKALKSFGVSPRYINDGTYARPLSEAEIADLIGLLGIPWPPKS